MEVGRYHKRALFGAWEKATFEPGRDTLLFPCAGLSVGVAICYDVEFPELIRLYARLDAHLVVTPTALMAPHDRIARQLVPVRAMENQLFLAYCNRTGSEGDLDFVGLSRVCGPRGEVIVSASTAPELLVAELSPVRSRPRARGEQLPQRPGLHWAGGPMNHTCFTNPHNRGSPPRGLARGSPEQLRTSAARQEPSSDDPGLVGAPRRR